VYPYSDEEHIAEAVGIFAAAGLTSNESVVLIATAEKQHAIEQRLREEAFDVEELQREGRLTSERGYALGEAVSVRESGSRKDSRPSSVLL